jgi:hypothetical protein
MDSCGFLTLRTTGIEGGAVRGRRGLAFLILLVWTASGCSLSPTFRYGRIPMVTLPSVSGAGATYGRMPEIESKLAALRKGGSDKGDALRLLGAPKGYGMARLTAASPQQVVWQYEFLETRDKRFAVKELVLFFSGEKYDGYFWFSSQQEIHEK